MAKEINMFVIYAREDKDVKLNLLRHLNPFKEAFNLSIWHDDQIEPGQQWKPHIESRLNFTDVFLLLVSVDFMNSQFIKQTEFKAAIDRHKANKSVVIPVIINYCQWDIDFTLIDYTFNIKELQVLPDEAKPVGDWNSPDQAYNNIAAGVRKVLTTIQNNRKKEDKEEKINAKNKAETEAKQKAEEEKRLAAESEAKRKAEETQRLKEAEEAKKEAEEAHRKVEAEEKQKAEEAKQKAEEEQRIKAEAESKKKAEEAQRKAEEEQRLKEAAEAQKKAEAEAKQKFEEEQRLKAEAEAEANRKAEEEAEKQRAEAMKKADEAAANQKAEEEQRLKAAAEANKKAEEEAEKPLTTPKPTEQKKSKYIVPSIIAVVLVTVAIVVFSMLSPKPDPPKPEPDPIAKKDSIAWHYAQTEAQKTDSIPLKISFYNTYIENFRNGKFIEEARDRIEELLVEQERRNDEEAFANLKVGDLYLDGKSFVIEIDHSTKSGKIVYQSDSGPMLWQDADNIHETLGDGWRLPTYDEYKLMYEKIGDGGTKQVEFNTEEAYWSSTPYSSNQVYRFSFKFPYTNSRFHNSKTSTTYRFPVRAIKDFKH